MIYNDDIFINWLGIGSQLAGLGHIGHAHDGKNEFYNCLQGRDITKTTGMSGAWRGTGYGHGQPP